MGLTKHTYDLITKHCNLKGTMLELGDQIIYFGSKYGEYSTPYFKRNFPNLKHMAVDIKPEKYAVELDLRVPFEDEMEQQFDSITNAGTTEHIQTVEGFHIAFENIHKGLKIGGVVVHENPKTGNWKGHGEHYMTQKFYTDLASDMGYEILEMGEHPAMGNSKDGWNVYCVLKKVDDRPFVPFEVLVHITFTLKCDD